MQSEKCKRQKENDAATYNSYAAATVALGLGLNMLLRFLALPMYCIAVLR